MQVAVIFWRLLHVITGVLWVGGAVLMSIYILPAIRASGPAGGQVMQQLLQRKFPAYLPALGGLAVVSGIALFWHNDAVSNHQFGPSRGGMTISVGGACALLALIIGGVMIGRPMKELAQIGGAIAASGGRPSAEQVARMAVLQGRARTGTALAFVLLTVTVVTMAIWRYV